MQRRKFLSASLATTAAAFAQAAHAQPVSAAPREFYQLRRYTLRSGPQVKLNEDYFGAALFPALRRLGFGLLEQSCDFYVGGGDWNVVLSTGPVPLAGNSGADIRELSGLNHLFQTARTGQASEYASIEETIAPSVLELLSTWITQRTR